LNPTIPFPLSGNLGGVLGDRIVKVAHAPQPVNDAGRHRRSASDRAVDAAEVVNRNVIAFAAAALFLCAESAARMTA
jgi:hypothetical protein